MTFIPQDGSDLRPLAFSGWEGDMDALKIGLALVKDVAAKRNVIDLTNVKDIKPDSIEANLSHVKTAIEGRKMSGELRDFRIMSEIQKKFWAAASANENLLPVPAFPHHENIIWSGAEEKWVLKDAVLQTGLINAPLSYVFGPIVTNPHSFDKSPKENIQFVADADRVRRMIEATADTFGINPDEVATAGSIFCYDVACKRAWSIANQGQIAEGQVAPEHFLAVDDAIRASGYGMKFG